MKSTKLYSVILQSLAFSALTLLGASCAERRVSGETAFDQGIMVWKENPFYFQYKGEPILLLGASDYHNIFQRPDLVEHLEKMHSLGGNYVRNTMASREINAGHNDLWPYEIIGKTDDPLINIYDLDQWNDEYWRRFSHMLDETLKRGIIVEIEFWERHDTYRTRDQAGWLRHPYNPDNNINFTAEESGLPAGEWVRIAGQRDTEHPFFNTVPSLLNNKLVLGYQEAFIDKLLSYTVDYDHILYNMNNETQEHHYFGEYWAEYLLTWAGRHGKHIELTDMQDNHDVTEAPVARVIESDIYTFVDISQNNFQREETHWERIGYIRDLLKDSPKPITNVKVYGDAREGVHRFWRNIIGGCASARFHRPHWGIGLNETAMANLKSMRMITDSMDFFNHRPSNHLLKERSYNEAYCMAYKGKEYLIYFPAAGSVFLDADPGTYEVLWLNTMIAGWQEPYNTGLPSMIQTPDEDSWVVLFRRIQFSAQGSH
jgi:hypothetical protein